MMKVLIANDENEDALIIFDEFCDIVNDVCFVLARVRNLEKSILNLQINRSSSDSLIGKRYYIIIVNNQLNVCVSIC